MKISICKIQVNFKNWGISIQDLITFTLFEIHRCTKLILILETNYILQYLDYYLNGAMELEIVIKMQCYLFLLIL